MAMTELAFIMIFISNKCVNKPCYGYIKHSKHLIVVWLCVDLQVNLRLSQVGVSDIPVLLLLLHYHNVGPGSTLQLMSL